MHACMKAVMQARKLLAKLIIPPNLSPLAQGEHL
jgi:hypothetical protein